MKLLKSLTGNKFHLKTKQKGLPLAALFVWSISDEDR
jgi:hypothetical protein